MKTYFLSLTSLLLSLSTVFAQDNFVALEAQKKVDALMTSDIEHELGMTNGGMSVSYKIGKEEYACDFRVQNGRRKSSCDGLDTALRKLDFVSRRSFKFDGWFEGVLDYELEFPDYLDIPKDVKKKGWYLTNKMENFRIKEEYVEDGQEGDLTYVHRESGSDNYLFYFEDEANLINPSKFNRKYDRQQVYKGTYNSYYPNSKRRTRNAYEVEKNTFLRQNTVKANVNCEIEVTVYGTFTKWYESGKKFYEVVYDETYIKNFIVNEGKHQDESLEDGKLKGKYTAWHENGQLLCEGVLKNGKREGVWKFYDLNGFLIERINYLNGKIKGEYLSFFINGQKREKVTYYNDFKVGLGYTYYQDGTVRTKTEYVRGEKFGLYQKYDNMGRLIINGYYHRNDQTDKWESFYASGKLREVRFFKLGLLHGLRNKFFPDGVKEFEAKYENGKESGEFTIWFNNGIKNIFGKFHKGLKNGTWYKFYKSGSKKEFVNYALASTSNDSVLSIWYEGYELKKEKHLRNGLWVKYHENGQKMFEGSFTNGRLDGKQVYFDTSGVVVRKEIYVAGERKGDIQKYHPNGSLKMKGNFADDVNFYIEAYFNEKGVQTIIAGKGKIESVKNGCKKVVQYDNGSPHGAWKTYYPSGELMEEGEYSRGEETGEYTQYNEDGSLHHKGHYINGIEDGHWKHFSKNGVLQEKGKYVDGEKVGMWMYYYGNGEPKEKLEYKENGDVLVWDYWSIKGLHKVVNGEGEYIDRDKNGVKIKGMLSAGVKEGQWGLAKATKSSNYFVEFKNGQQIK